MMYFAEANPVLYRVDIELGVIIAMVYTIAYVSAFLTNEFIGGWLRYVMLVVFTGSFAALWWILLLDSSIAQRLIILGVILFGGVSGFWHFIGDLFEAIKNRKK